MAERFFSVTFVSEETVGVRNYAAGTTTSLPESVARGLGRAVTINGVSTAVLHETADQSALIQSIATGYSSVPGNSYAAVREERAARMKAMMQFPGPTLLFDFSEQSGSSVYDKVSQRPAVLNAGTVSWSTDGVLFNGSGAFQFAANTMDGICGTVCDLSTLGADDAITVAFVYRHTAALANIHPLFYYGCSSENTCGGWGLVARTNGKIFFYHRAKESGAEFSINLANREPGNQALNNTRTAMCVEIRRSPDDPGYFEIAMADRPLEASAEIQSVGLAIVSTLLKGDGSGTGPATYSTLGPLTIGGKPAATYTNLTPQLAGNNGALLGLELLAIQRYRYVPGRFQAILEDLAADAIAGVKTPPNALFMEA